MKFSDKIKIIREECLSEREKKAWREGWRKTGELTGRELAEMLGVNSKSTIHNWETGKTVSRDPKILKTVEILWKEAKKRREEREERLKAYGWRR